MYVFNHLRGLCSFTWEDFVHSLDTVGILDNRCLNFLFIIASWANTHFYLNNYRLYLNWPTFYAWPPSSSSVLEFCHHVWSQLPHILIPSYKSTYNFYFIESGRTYSHNSHFVSIYRDMQREVSHYTIYFTTLLPIVTDKQYYILLHRGSLSVTYDRSMVFSGYSGFL